MRNSSVKDFKEDTYNYNLKGFCKMANLDRTITRKDSLGKSVSKPLYEVVSTHCARYTFIRSMWKKAIVKWQLQRWSDTQMILWLKKSITRRQMAIIWIRLVRKRES